MSFTKNTRNGLVFLIITRCQTSKGNALTTLFSEWLSKTDKRKVKKMPKRLTSDDPNIPFPRDPEYLQMMYNRLRQLEQALKNGELVKAGKVKKAVEEPPKADYEAIIGAYNSICLSLPKCRSLTDKLRKAMNARISDGNSMEDIREVFIRAEASDLLTGRKPGKNHENFKANIRWLLLPDNFEKAITGCYDNADDGKDRRNWDDAFEKMALNVKSPPDTGISDRPKENIT